MLMISIVLELILLARLLPLLLLTPMLLIFVKERDV